MSRPATELLNSAELAREAYLDALFSGCSAEVTVPLGREMARLENEADPALKARSLRTKARDERAAYQRHMNDYGREIGRTSKDPTIAKLIESAAKAALDEASECLTRALAHEDKADRIETSGFITLFDGVSARRVA